MRTKRSFAILFMVLYIAFLFGCSNSSGTTQTQDTTKTTQQSESTQKPQEAEDSDTEDSNLNPVGTYPIVKEKVTLTALATPNPNIIDMETNYVTKWFEDKTNVHIDWEVVPGSEAQTKINLMIASGGTLPDFMIGGSIADKLTQITYGMQGIFQPLENLIRTQTVGLMAMLEQEPHLWDQMTAPDGHIYSIGNYEVTFHSQYYQKAWINKTWLDTLGLEAPTTTDELYDVLMAFKTRDPNQNRKADEIPLSGNTSAYFTQIEGWLMNSFVYDDVKNRINVTDGKIWVPYTTDEWREGLGYINKLYVDGLLDPESFTQDQTQIKQLVDGEDIRLGMSFGGSPTAFATGTLENWHNYVIQLPVTGPNGFRTTGYYPPTVTDGRFVITKDCKNPEIAMRWLDVFYDTDNSLVIWFGEEGVDWKKAEPGELGIDGKPAYWKEINILRTMPQQNKGWLHLGPRYGTRDIAHGRAVPADNPWYHEVIMYEATQAYADLNITPEEVLPPLFIMPDVADEYAELKSTIDSYVSESFARFVIGDLSIDKDWDSYIASLEAMGLPRYIEIVQKAYDAYRNK